MTRWNGRSWVIRSVGFYRNSSIVGDFGFFLLHVFFFYCFSFAGIVRPRLLLTLLMWDWLLIVIPNCELQEEEERDEDGWREMLFFGL